MVMIEPAYWRHPTVSIWLNTTLMVFGLKVGDVVVGWKS